MTISINWASKVISVPKADMSVVQLSPTEIRSLDINTFRLTLKDLEDDEAGMPFIRTHNHNTEVTVGGVTLARVIEIINGYTVTFEDGQYAVNLLGANSNIADVTNVNQVSVRSANSAGLVTSQAIESGEFGNKIWVDETAISSGTTYPKGTQRDPVSTLEDAKVIAGVRGFDNIQLIGDFTFLASDILDGYVMHGQSIGKSSITLTALAAITNCTFKDATILGYLDGNSELYGCHLSNLDYADGIVNSCELGSGVIKLGNTEAVFLNCYSGVAGGAATPVIDFDDGGSSLIVRNYSGGIEFRNKTQGGAVSIDMNSGQVILAPSMNFGSVTIRGITKVVDNSGAGITINDETVSGVELRELHRLRGLNVDNPVTVTQTQETAGDITLDITGDGVTTNTLTRQP